MFYVTLKIDFLNKTGFKVPEVPKKVPEKYLSLYIKSQNLHQPKLSLITEHVDEASYCFCTFVIRI